MTDTTEFEYSVIGAICIDSRIIDKISTVLSPDDFTISACADIYESALDAVSRGKSFDVVYAHDVAKRRLEDAAGFIKNCMDLCPSCTQSELHAKEIHKRAQLRNLNEAISEKLYLTGTQNINPNELAADIAGVCQEFLATGRSYRYSTMAEALGKVYNRVTSPEKEQTVDTGFKRLDAMLKGMPKGNLILIGARPSVGKSAFASSIAEHVARTNGTVMLYSLEMEDDEYAERSLSKSSGIEMDKLIDCDIEESQQGLLASVCGKLGELPIKIFDTPNVKPSDIRQDFRMLKDVKLIIIDFISLMQADKKNPQNRNLELGSISRDLKNLAKELGVPIIALSQLNRTKDEKSEPNLSDLRDSGELEQNANKVLFLWQLDAFSDGSKRVGVSVAKNRRGRLGAVEMEFDGSHMCYEEIGYMSQEQRQTTQQKPKYGAGIVD